MRALFLSTVHKLPLFLVFVIPVLAFGETPTEESQQLLTILKETAMIAEATNRLALLVFGGSVAALISTSYLQPKERKVRLVYFLFVPGWFALMWAMYRGHQVCNVYLSAMHVVNEPELYYKLQVLWQLEEQSAALYLSLVPFSLWFVIFLIWWVWKGEHG